MRNQCLFVTDTWAKNQKKIFQPGNAKLAELHAILSMLKAWCTWTSYQGILECRRACGGLGYSYYSLFSQYLTCVDVECTWEGDNNVLLQQTGKYLLYLYKSKMKGNE